MVMDYGGGVNNHPRFLVFVLRKQAAIPKLEGAGALPPDLGGLRETSEVSGRAPTSSPSHSVRHVRMDFRGWPVNTLAGRCDLGVFRRCRSQRLRRSGRPPKSPVAYSSLGEDRHSASAARPARASRLMTAPAFRLRGAKTSRSSCSPAGTATPRRKRSAGRSSRG